jgi:hypothetical protein
MTEAKSEKSVDYKLYMELFKDKYNKNYKKYLEENRKQRLTKEMWEAMFHDLHDHFNLNRLSSIFNAWLLKASKTKIIPQITDLEYARLNSWMNYNFDELIYHSEACTTQIYVILYTTFGN